MGDVKFWETNPSREHVMRKALIAAGGLALALTLGACGDKIGGTATAFDQAPDLVAAAKESAAEKKTAKITMDMNMGIMTMKGNGQARFDGANTAMAMTMQVMGQSVEMRMLDKTMYMKLPAGMPGSDPAKPWAKMSMADLAGAGQNLDKMMEQSDPTKTLELLQQSGTIVSSEETQLDGQSATHYKVDVDFAKAMEQFGAGAAGAAELEEMKKAGIKKMPIDVWLSDDNLPLQFEIQLGDILKKVSQQQGQTMPPGMEQAKMTMKYTDWGGPVTIEAPPADQVGDHKIPGMGGN